jgi:hypothetical protein
MKSGEDLLGCQEPVGDHADKERGDHRGQSGRAGGQSDLLAREPQRLAQPRAHRDGPRSPDEVLEEHQGTQFQADRQGHE